MQLNRAWIEAHIPHQGRMCLLDEVIDWDRAAHQLPQRRAPRRGSSAARAWPARRCLRHGIRGAGDGGAWRAHRRCAPIAKPRAGFLASVRGVRLHVSRLDDVQSDLICDAVRIAGDQRTALYEFELRCATMRLMSGRATVVLDANHRPDR